MIAPGKGSSAYYTPEVLKRDGPSVFPKFTKVFLNHATAAEEAQRPEGDVKDLAGVTTSPAEYLESGPAGAGLYARMKVFSDHGVTVEEKAPYIGMSIRGFGDIETAGGKPVMREGVPLLKKLTAARSVDVVTEAGAGGMILTEAARPAAETPTPQGGADDMDAADFKKLQESNAALLAEFKKLQESHTKLQESNVEAITEGKKLRERRFIEEGATEVSVYLKTVSVSEAVKEQVLRRLKERFAMPGGIPLTEAGAIDTAKVKALAETETNDELAFLRKVNPRLVEGMGSTAKPQLTEAQIAERAKDQKRQDDETQQRFAGVMGFGQIGSKGRKVLAEGRRAFDVNYNARLNGNRPDNGGTLTMEGE